MAKRVTRAWRDHRAGYLRRPDLESEPARIVTGAKACSRLLAIGAGLCLATIAGRLFAGSAELSLGAVHLPLGFAWVGLLAITVAHAFTGAFLAERITKYLPYLHLPGQALQVFRDVTSSGNPFVFGLRSRALPRRPGGRYHPMSLRDPSAWVAYGAAAILLLAVLPWHLEAGRISWSGGVSGWGQVVLAVVLLAVNWWAGSVWMVSLSRLHYLGTELRDLRTGPLGRDEVRRLLRPLEPAEVAAFTEPDLYRLANLLERFAERPLPRADVRDCIGSHPEARKRFAWARSRPNGLCTDHSRLIEATYRLVAAAGLPMVLADVPNVLWAHRSAEYESPERLAERMVFRRRGRRPKRDRWWNFVS
ncbi:hypothetical protein ACIA49_14960 [Kribbella sp. NPDC051587]|uniref:hypothetical protein n=1 Tax=Kribbella sp. NPDC051587 TaxID=3364119 RepID=UPI0037A30F58